MIIEVALLSFLRRFGGIFLGGGGVIIKLDKIPYYFTVSILEQKHRPKGP